MEDINLRRFCSIIRIDMVLENQEGTLTPCFDTVDDSILVQNTELRDQLRTGASHSDRPYILQDEYGIYFAAISSEHDFLYIGPMCLNAMSPGKQRRFYAGYGILSKDVRGLHRLPLPEMYNVIMLAASLFLNTVYEDQDITYLSRFSKKNEHLEKAEQSDYLLKEEFENEDNVYRHTYYEEQMLMQAIRNGEGEKAVQIADIMDSDSGRLARQSIQHWKNLSIIGITLCARAMIESGITPETAYRTSGFFIQKCEIQANAASVRNIRNNALREMASLVNKQLNRKHTSSYTEKCKDYIHKHFREKIYLDDIAEALKISSGHLSRLFHKEAGLCIQDYVTQVRVERASNLLLYSSLSLSEIAEYVNFPSQSYFGHAFKKRKGISPRQYRDLHRSKEFWESRNDPLSR